jgi:lysophospholipase L1-like esterase
MIKFVLIFLCSLLTTSNASAKDLEGEVIILIGDSQMIGTVDPPRRRWGDNHMGPRLEKILVGRGAKVVRIARGASGAHFWIKTLKGTYKGYLRTKQTKRWTIDFLKEQKPTQIVINLGGNDSGHTERYFQKYALPLMKELKNITSNVTWLGPGPGRHERSHRNRTHTDKILKDLAAQVGVSYVSMLGWVSKDDRLKNLTPRQIRYDGIHYKNFPAQCYAEAISTNVRNANDEI